MTKKSDTPIISVMHPVCCGLDVHKNIISACLITLNPLGSPQYEVREFPTFTDSLFLLRDWLTDNNCPTVAMESTSVYWRPVHNILEGHLDVVLVNARHIKNVPGRKTDTEDSRWLANLLRHGLVKGSFIPAKEVRQWRDLTTLRKNYTQTLGDYKRRVHKLFETANIKISSVVTDLFGVTGRNLISLLCDEDADLSLENIEKCAKGSLGSKSAELHRSIQGFFEDHHRFQLKLLMDTIEATERNIKSVTARLARLMRPHQEVLDRLDEVYGINTVAGQSVLSHIGFTLEEFGNEAAFCSWAGLCPGNNESAGKRKSGRSPVRNHPFKTVMVEIAWSAIKKRDSYYKDKYYRIKYRRGAKKAVVAVAHSIAKGIYHIIKYGESFEDLGKGYLSGKNQEKKINRLKKQAAQLGYDLVASA
ncbi:IS110 family transposase [Desulfonema magnum]|nr:IS110 family transposase [Desulfonema magnum]QTA85468.1 Transposase, IS116/IS110/IS902 family [Desulfonema magnum]QTA86828.1 Transposase, IS116/IS110/IS902 family [Desulfonema magnum]QTA86830.1 Transposase, IS116/IS110/IS902 family [Desulfonema magnum]QTA86832.1 Transposase, IS116/IS110/IS902 family [Desulfonema magnum]QTA87946.1 Transposase, IS116/IS110/IS902 family [Desulfonema magnum]